MSILKADKILRPDGETLLDTTGSVLQTKSTHVTAYGSTNSSSYVTLGSYQVSITLSHADNKVLVMGGFYDQLLEVIIEQNGQCSEEARS